MNPATRLGMAFRRIAATSSVRLVRRDDARRHDLHGGLGNLNARFASFAEEMDRQATQADLG